MKKKFLEIIEILKEYGENQTPEMCLEAVKQNGGALEYVNKELQTPEMCMEAVKENGYALKYVKEQTPEMCMEAVKQNGRALGYVKEQTPEICMEAVRQNKYSIDFVKDKSMLQNTLNMSSLEKLSKNLDEFNETSKKTVKNNCNLAH